MEKQKKKEILASREWERIFKTLSHPMTILDANQNIIAANDVLEKLIGKKAGGLKGVKCWEIFHGPAVKGPPPGCPFVQMVSSSNAGIREMAVETFNGTYLVSCTPIFDDKGHLDKVVHLATDITEQKKAETALKERDIRFNKLSSHVPGMIYQFMRRPDGSYCVPFSSEAIKEIFGCTPEEVRDDFSPIAKVILPEDLDKVVGSIEHSANHLATWQCEYRVQIPGKPIRWMLGHSTPEQLPDGGIIWHGFNTDITERRLAEEALRASEEKYRRHFANANDVIFSLDANGVFISISPSIERYIGYKPEELIGRPFTEVNILSPESFDRAVSDTLKVFQGERVEGAEYEFVAKDGSRRFGELSSSPIVADGRVVATASVARNITDRKRMEAEKEELEAQLLQAQKMEAVGRLAGGIAHDFNNLLTGITGNVSMALMDLSEDDPLRHNLEEVAVGAERAAKLTGRLLAFSRRQIIEPKVIDLNELLRGLERMLGRLLREDIETVWLLKEGIGYIRVDPGQLEQVVVNLAINARDAMPYGGRLAFETADVELDEEYCRRHPDASSGPHVMLAVSDTGTGMDEATMRKIFDPFFTTKEKGKGAGLGLPTSYGIIRQHSGSIEVYSEIGHGTTFKIYLPRAEGKAERLARTTDGESLPTGTETVLVVEDDEFVRNIALKLLKHQGYQVLQAENGGEALRLAERHRGPVHLLLTDVVMPGMNGKDLAARLSSLRPEIKVLFTSGYTEDTIAHSGVLDPDIDFIGKPYSPQALARKVREVLDGQSQKIEQGGV